MSVSYLRSIGFSTKRKVPKVEKWSAEKRAEQRIIRQKNLDDWVEYSGHKKWLALLERIYEHHLYVLGKEPEFPMSEEKEAHLRSNGYDDEDIDFQKGIGRWDYASDSFITRALKYNKKTEEYKLKLSLDGIPLMFGKTSSLFFSGDVLENFRNLGRKGIIEGHLDKTIKQHYLAVERKKKAFAKKAATKAKEKRQQELDAFLEREKTYK